MSFKINGAKNRENINCFWKLIIVKTKEKSNGFVVSFFSWKSLTVCAVAEKNSNCYVDFKDRKGLDRKEVLVHPVGIILEKRFNFLTIRGIHIFTALSIRVLSICFLLHYYDFSLLMSNCDIKQGHFTTIHFYYYNYYYSYCDCFLGSRIGLYPALSVIDILCIECKLYHHDYGDQKLENIRDVRRGGGLIFLRLFVPQSNILFLFAIFPIFVLL